jgi:hypothetical protein
MHHSTRIKSLLSEAESTLQMTTLSEAAVILNNTPKNGSGRPVRG